MKFTVTKLKTRHPRKGGCIMSTLHHEDLLLSIFDEVQEAFPYLDEEKQIEIANNRFEDLCQ